MVEDLRDNILEEAGRNHDVELSLEVFEQVKPELEESRLTHLRLLYPNAKVYRPKSEVLLHITDFRDSRKNGVGAYVGNYNPVYYPFRHLLDLVDWHLKFLKEKLAGEGYEVKKIEEI